MKRYILQLILVVVLLSSCAPKTADEIQPVSTATTITTEAASAESGKILDGQWSYECDELGFNRYTWSSQIRLEHADATVKIDFDDWDAQLGEVTTLAFIIKTPSLPRVNTRWLYVRTDGTFDPKASNFDGIDGPMDVYPGGYPAFEEELIAMDFDWVNMYLKAKTEFLAMYYVSGNQCTPPIQLDTQSG